MLAIIGKKTTDQEINRQRQKIDTRMYVATLGPKYREPFSYEMPAVCI